MKTSFFILLIFLVVACTQVNPRRPINPKASTTILSQAIKESKALNKLEEERILKSIEKDSTQAYIDSKNGFWYTYHTKIDKDLPTPKTGDQVILSYNITDLNGQVIYHRDSIGLTTYVVDQEDLITGLQKGIKLMKKGETITFVIPSYSAFGIAGDGNKIGINTTIKSKVTLITIN